LADSGHSLGGALSTLAAFDIKQALLKASRGDVKLLCYSFGAPRTGSHAFARDYNKMVPDTWSIINNQVCSVLQQEQCTSTHDASLKSEMTQWCARML
jgi:predicted lipase